MDRAYRLTRQQLYDLVWTRSLNALAAEFGISGNALAKICDRLLVPHPPRGYWSGAARTRMAPKPPLPPPPPGSEADVVISSQRARSRRTRTRLSLPARREQIVETAAGLIAEEGVAAATMKRIARELGISEALGYTYFASQTDLLTFIARREQAEMAQMQSSEQDKYTDYLDRVRASMVGYLDYVAKRGALLQTLLGSADVREALRQEHRSRRAWSAATSASNMTRTLDVPPDLALAGTQVLRAMGVRAGKLLGMGKIDRETAGRLARWTMDGARVRLMALSEARAIAPLEEGPQPLQQPSPGKPDGPGRRRAG